MQGVTKLMNKRFVSKRCAVHMMIRLYYDSVLLCEFVMEFLMHQLM